MENFFLGTKESLLSSLESEDVLEQPLKVTLESTSPKSFSAPLLLPVDDEGGEDQVDGPQGEDEDEKTHPLLVRNDSFTKAIEEGGSQVT